METINHEYYVSLEVAKLLEKAGFGWVCRDYYYSSFITSQYRAYAKPTLDVTQRWLREVKGIHIEITFGGKWIYTPYNLTNLECLLPEDEFPETRNYNTYEEAQEAGIKKALEMILEKGE